MRAFLAACPPVSLSPPVTDLIITTCDFQKDLLEWNISPVNDAFDAKALFNMHITKRINDKRLKLLESCKLCKIFRLEPRFDDEGNPADENSKFEEAEEKKEKNFSVLDKQSQQTVKKEKALHENCDPAAQADLNNKIADAKVNAKALEVGATTTSSARNIPPHDLSATRPRQAYPIENIIFKGGWKYLLHIAETLQKASNLRFGFSLSVLLTTVLFKFTIIKKGH
nr:DNA-directed RNA polymerase I subunit RPA49 [Tanacetum cinerariifolium]